VLRVNKAAALVFRAMLREAEPPLMLHFDSFGLARQSGGA
jgi:hypothetical protein